MSPATVIQLFRQLGALEWRPLSRSDYMGFADAGEGARMADFSPAASAAIGELLDIRSVEPLTAIIGGDALQLEIYGVEADGEPIVWTLPIADA
jgi:hypothetical protein